MPRCLQRPEDAEMAVPAASMSLAAQRELAQSIRQEMGIPPDEEDEALAVCAPPSYHAAHPCFVHQVAKSGFRPGAR